ncbi:CLUMA_CG000950, isoform A [Clunio marinus]|uniref:CLUMA_CG000950, isoform A n=1 Tax=Clunio marinus TaxID=568069 RepID=A0A1J1HGL0_9DIPT|nr:CLUMA_CG000950, isoform A [Clunio marinus]
MDVKYLFKWRELKQNKLFSNSYDNNNDTKLEKSCGGYKVNFLKDKINQPNKSIGCFKKTQNSQKVQAFKAPIRNKLNKAKTKFNMLLLHNQSDNGLGNAIVLLNEGENAYGISQNILRDASISK